LIVTRLPCRTGSSTRLTPLDRHPAALSHRLLNAAHAA
jgi:hypothetical protein